MSDRSRTAAALSPGSAPGSGFVGAMMSTMMSTLVSALAAEFRKLTTLPLAVGSSIATVALGGVLGVAFALHAIRESVPATAMELVAAAVPYLVVGILLVGATPVGHEYAGRQIRVSITAVPHRGVFVAAKTAAALVWSAGTATLAMVANVAAVWVIRQSRGDAAALVPEPDSWLLQVLGAALFLTLVGLLAHAMTLVVRHLVPTLVIMMALTVLLPPVLAAFTEHARWLPTQAGALLFSGESDAVLNPGTGALVMVAWIVVVGAVGTVAMVRRDV